ncbi:hypothetical protein A5634_13655 [Mycobacterium asiaticum]|uniref:Uncharacterized protein n=1 Tax=Mycobacterium asiaticum TaxID=1790 RepID=A0A1A3PG94_MYCAS|nr:hypothetical protein A5634_13655 [Mycobacterium asiaticum]
MPAVFWRRGSLTADDNRCEATTLGGMNFFQTQRQLPAVAVITEIVQDIAGLTESFVESSLGGGQTVVVGPLLVVHVARAQEQLAVMVEGAAAE